MNCFNSLIVEGNLVHGKREENVFKFAIKYNHFHKDSDGNEHIETSFFDIECYGKLADLCEKQFQKDRGVRLIGRLKQVESKVVIVAEHVEFKKTN